MTDDALARATEMAFSCTHGLVIHGPTLERRLCCIPCIAAAIRAYGDALARALKAQLDLMAEERDAWRKAALEHAEEGLSLHWLVFVQSSTVSEPVAAFQFADHARQWAEQNYRGNYEIRARVSDKDTNI